MKTSAKVILYLFAGIMLSACSTSSSIIVPLDKTAPIHDTYTIIWYGKSEAYRYVNGEYKREEQYDYIFNVVQKRYDNKWKSVKSLHRLNPDYDGKAGERSQCMYFELAFSKSEKGVQSVLSSSLGEGSGISDPEFREQVLYITMKNVNRFYPYNKMKITQHYYYEKGELVETVELYKEIDGKITPFMKNEERAKFYLNGTLPNAPTLFK